MTHVPDSLSSRRPVERALADAFGERAATPSVQDLFLNTARRDRAAITVHLMTWSIDDPFFSRTALIFSIVCFVSGPMPPGARFPVLSVPSLPDK